MTDNDWLSSVASSPPDIKKPKWNTLPAPGSDVGNVDKNTRTDFAGKKIKGVEFPEPYVITSFDDIEPVPREPSILFPSGLPKGATISIVGPPGAGKTEYLIEESIFFSKEGKDVLYLYNESIKPKFDAYVRRIAERMHSDVSDLHNITFIDMLKFDLTTADYSGIDTFIQRIWVRQIRYWLEHSKNPSLIIIDSFSKMARRYVPQMYIAMEALTDHVSELFDELKIHPTLIISHQKSQSSRERNDESVSGGFGLTHISDATFIFKLTDVDIWASRRYGLPEGSKMHTIQVIKDRYANDDFQERVVFLADGRLILGLPVSTLVSDKDSNDHMFRRGL